MGSPRARDGRGACGSITFRECSAWRKAHSWSSRCSRRTARRSPIRSPKDPIGMTLLGGKGQRVKMGIAAPPELCILRVDKGQAAAQRYK